MMSRIAYFVFFLLCSMNLCAQGSDSLQQARRLVPYQGPEVRKLEIESRFGWQMLRSGGITDDDNTCFRGEYVKLKFDARLYKGLSFSWRQKLNMGGDGAFWNATEWMMLKYSFSPRWTVSAGKQIVAIGGYEYDYSPIDLYAPSSEFWHNIACYQFGLSAEYSFSADDRLLFQLCNSPFRSNIGSNNSYGLSLVWYGHHGLWESIWSLNAFQTTRNRWINYIAMGNKFTFVRKYLWLELDYMNRAGSGQSSFFDDFSIMTSLNTRPHSSVRIFAKYTFDRNRSGTDADCCVLDGTEMHTVSGGVEYEPFSKYPEILRLFAVAGYSWGENSNANGVLQDGQIRLNVGVRLNVDVLRGLKWAIQKW